MNNNQYVKSYKDLIVYQKTRQLAIKIYKITIKFPKEEMYSLTDQIRRSSRSIGAQIAEAWAKRRYIKHFASKLTDAQGEQFETQHWIDTSDDCEYLSEEIYEELNSDLQEIGAMLTSMILKADSFCRPEKFEVNETNKEYFY